MEDLPVIKFCYSCLCKSEERRLYSYKLQDEIKAILRVNNIDLCFLCTRLAQEAESFIQNVKSNWFLLANFEEVNATLLNILSEDSHPLINLTKCALEGIELTGEIDKDSQSVVVNNTENDAKNEPELEVNKNIVNNFEDKLKDSDHSKITLEEIELTGDIDKEIPSAVINNTKNDTKNELELEVNKNILNNFEDKVEDSDHGNITLEGIEITGDTDKDSPSAVVNNTENDAKNELELEVNKNIVNNFEDIVEDSDHDLDVKEDDDKPLKILKEELELEGKKKCVRKSSKKIKIKKTKCSPNEEEKKPFKILKEESKRTKRKYVRKSPRNNMMSGKKNTQELLDLITEGIKIEMVSITREQCMEERAQLKKDEKYVLSLYKCEDCIKGFNYKHKCDKHMEKHSQKNGDYECDICKQRMSSEERLVGHKRYHLVRYKCVECGLTRITRLSIMHHYHTTHEESISVYRCSYCSKGFSRQVKLNRHILCVHTNKERVECHYCHKTYCSKDSLKIHIGLRHPEEITLKLIQNHACQLCRKAFSAPSQLRTHMIKHTQSRNHYCVECDKSFKSETILKHHFKTTKSHTNYSDLPLQCSECGKRFAVRRDLDLHVNRMHLKIKPFRCELCDKAYVNSWGLNDHRRMVHEGYKRPLKYSCTMCDKAFARKHILQSHIRTHTGDRPYQCSQCPAQFNQAGILRTHFKLIHLKLTRDGRPKATSKRTLNRQGHANEITSAQFSEGSINILRWCEI